MNLSCSETTHSKFSPNLVSLLKVLRIQYFWKRIKSIFTMRNWSKEIDKLPIEKEHQRKFIFSLVKKFKEIYKNANKTKSIAAAAYHLVKIGEINLELNEIWNQWKIPIKGFSKFYTKFRLALNLSSTPIDSTPCQFETYIKTENMAIKAQIKPILESNIKMSLAPTICSETSLISCEEPKSNINYTIQIQYHITNYWTLIINFLKSSIQLKSTNSNTS